MRGSEETDGGTDQLGSVRPRVRSENKSDGSHTAPGYPNATGGAGRISAANGASGETGATMECQRCGKKILEIGKTVLEVRMSEANKALVKRWFDEVWNEGRRETVRELMAPDAVIQEGNEASVYWS